MAPTGAFWVVALARLSKSWYDPFLGALTGPEATVGADLAVVVASESLTFSCAFFGPSSAFLFNPLALKSGLAVGTPLAFVVMLVGCFDTGLGSCPVEGVTDVEALFPSRLRKEAYPESYGGSASCIKGEDKLREQRKIKTK